MKPFTMIPNDYLEALMKRADITNREYRVLLCIMRKTYGYHTDKAKISGNSISRETGIPYPHVHEALKSLEAKGLVCVDSPGSKKTKNYRLIDISRIESELIPMGVQELIPTGGTTINKYIYKEIASDTPGGYKIDATQPPQPPLPPQEKKAATKTEFIEPLPTVAGASISKVSSEFNRWIAPINERMQKHFDDREAE
ncbi:MAG: replication protein [Nitrospirae bacterium]|nr:replication protein [Nitrospirota bacterium]